MFQLFRKPRPAPPPQPKRRLDDAPEGELERALEVKRLCAMAADGIGCAGNGRLLDFRHAFRRAFMLASLITDKYYHDRALLYLIDAALAADEIGHAQLLLRAIEVESNRKYALKRHPQLAAIPHV